MSNTSIKFTWDIDKESTAADLLKVLEHVPDEASIRVEKYYSAEYGAGSTSSIKFEWTLDSPRNGVLD